MSPLDAPAATMPAETTHLPAHRLKLRSQVSDLALLWPWVDALAAGYAIPAATLYAIHLSLEEAVSNIIRHGYQGLPGHFVTVDFTEEGRRELTFTVEDQAPAFDPLAYSAVSEMPPPDSIDRLQPGGHGIRLLHKFARSLAYQRLDGGNRLAIRFTIQP